MYCTVDESSRLSKFVYSHSFDSTRYPTAASRGRCTPHTILQSQFDRSLPAGLLSSTAVDPAWRMAGNANSSGTPSPSRIQRLATSTATSLLSLCASRATRIPLTIQAKVNMICLPSARTSASSAGDIFSFSMRHARLRTRLLFASWMFETESSTQLLNIARLFPRVKCRTVSLARTFVVPSQTLLLAVSLHKRLTLNSGSSGSSIEVSHVHTRIVRHIPIYPTPPRPS